MDINLVVDKIKLLSNKEKIKKQHICPICGNETSNTIYCSDKCRQKAKAERYQSKNYPSKEMILEKYSELKSWEKVAKFYNITRKIVQRIRKNP